MQIIVNGLINGSAIALLALAFAVVYVPARILHIALGGIYVLAPYVAWAMIRAGLPWPGAVLLAVATGVALSLAIERFNHMPLELRGAPEGTHIISSLGIYIVVVQIVSLLWGSETQMLRTELSGSLYSSYVVITYPQVLVIIGVGALLVGFFTWLRASARGLQFRALADNPKELALRGYDVRLLRLLAFGISGLLAAAAGLLVAYDVGFNPNVGLPALLLAIVAAIIGGRSTFIGAVLGGLLLGIVRAEVVWLLSIQWQEAVTFALLALFLYLRPRGIIQRKTRLEAEV